jgi:hypothetical protein
MRAVVGGYLGGGGWYVLDMHTETWRYYTYGDPSTRYITWGSFTWISYESGGGFPLDGGYGGSLDDAEVARKPIAPRARSRFDVECNDDVRHAMERAWGRSSNGTSGVEATFTLGGTPTQYKVADAPHTNEQMRQTVPLAADAFSLFHVHPNRGDPAPSAPDRKIADDLYAQGRDFVMFTFSKGGLYAYDPKDQSTTLLRNGLDWLSPCE